MSEELTFSTVTEIQGSEAETVQNIVTPQKKKKGRPTKAEAAAKAAANGNPVEQKETKQKSIDPFEQLEKDILANKANLNPEAEQQQGATTTATVDVKENAKKLINGYMLLLLMDIVFPSLIKMIFKKAAKEIPTKALKMDEDQRKDLEPLADQVAEHVLSFLDPITLFFVVAGGTYYMNFQTALDAIEEKKLHKV